MMARKIYPYSLHSKDAKIAGVCSTLGAKTGLDPTFIRIAWVAIPILTHIPVSLALIAYAAVGIYLALQKRKSAIGFGGPEGGDPINVEIRKSSAEGRSLSEYRQPGQPCLIDLENEPLEQHLLVACREPVFGIVVGAVHRMAGCQPAVCGAHVTTREN